MRNGISVIPDIGDMNIFRLIIFEIGSCIEKNNSIGIGISQESYFITARDGPSLRFCAVPLYGMGRRSILLLTNINTGYILVLE